MGAAVLFGVGLLVIVEGSGELDAPVDQGIISFGIDALLAGGIDRNPLGPMANGLKTEDEVGRSQCIDLLLLLLVGQLDVGWMGRDIPGWSWK